ncbi:MAG: glutamine synthetase family protein [Oscillospiraceae bacterium]|nr:glutamine synthetase family protein [Oscillospiraceae bacterium]
MDCTMSEIISFIEENDVKFIRLAFCDIFGVQKNISILPGELGRAFETGISFDSSAVKGLQDEPDDLFLVPDPGTLAILPWRPSQGRVMRFFCDIRRADGTPYEACSRSILKKAVEHAAQLGYTCRFGTECEFYLLQTDEMGEPTMIPHDRAGYGDLAPLDKGENVRREICLTLEEMGLQPETSHHEQGPGQNEIDFRFSNALEAADNLLAFRGVVKAIAARNGLYATFMPKPFPDKSGSGMHINLSLSKNGKNIFRTDGTAHSEEAEKFMEGILSRVREITAFLNPLTNSYSRFGSFEAPRYVTWSRKNRFHLVRVPAAGGEHARIELRSPDPCCNPYLAFALLIEAGLSGIRSGAVLRPPCTMDVTRSQMPDGAERLPETLDEALQIAEGSDLVHTVLPGLLTGQYFSIKRQECVAREMSGDAFEKECYFPFY